MTGSTQRHRGDLGLRVARVFDGAIALTGFVALSLLIGGVMAPRFSSPIPPASVSSDGGYAFVFTPKFAARWPYAVPSHPDFALAPGDVRLMEDGRPIGALDPSNAEIRERGGGRYNLWQGALWFSAGDGNDPRTNGRDYRLIVDGRLDALPALVLGWSLSAFVILAAFRIASAVSARAAPPIARAAGAAFAPAERVLRRVPLSFRRAFWLVTALGLGIFAWQALSRPMPLMFDVDSFTYVQPGVLWDAGRDVAGQSTRGVGYPAVAALALALGSLDRLPLIQLVLVLAGLACILQVLCRTMRLIGARLASVACIPVALTAVCACGISAGYLALMFSHDLFVIDIYSAMGEAPHVLPTAAAFALFVGSWTSRVPVRRLCFATAAVASAYLSIMVKPHTVLVLALCALSVAVVALRHRGAFRSPAVLATCLASALAIGLVHRVDSRVTPPGWDFGPKTIFCNHLDVVAPVFDASTPGRARIASLMRDVLQAPSDWTLMGFEGDRCVYNSTMTDAIGTVARAEGRSPAAWQIREVLKAVATRPAAYAGDVLRQFAYYLRHPVVDIDHRSRSLMPDDVWARFAPFMGRIRMSHDQFLEEVVNWVPAAYPRLSGVAKTVLGDLGATFVPIALGGPALALVALLTLRGRADVRPEAAVVATAAFTSAFVMTTAISHSFDISRYLTDIMPFTLIWWALSAAYLAHGLALCGALAARRRDVPPASRGVRAEEAGTGR